jgi:hypothetical protein
MPPKGQRQPLPMSLGTAGKQCARQAAPNPDGEDSSTAAPSKKVRKVGPKSPSTSAVQTHSVTKGKATEVGNEMPPYAIHTQPSF